MIKTSGIFLLSFCTSVYIIYKYDVSFYLRLLVTLKLIAGARDTLPWSLLLWSTMLLFNEDPPPSWTWSPQPYCSLAEPSLLFLHSSPSCSKHYAPPSTTPSTPLSPRRQRRMQRCQKWCSCSYSRGYLHFQQVI